MLNYVPAPESFALHPAYPNPFNPSTTISFDVPYSTDVKLIVFDVSGRIIDVLIDNEISSGYHQIQWNAKNNSAGIYIIKLLSENVSLTKKITLIK